MTAGAVALPTAEALADRAMTAPRYTSYPPATAFAALDDRLARAEFTQLAAAGSPVSLYVHIPFCRALCWYCGCNVTVTRSAERGNAYVDTLITEAVRVAKALEGSVVTEISLGGGSPNFLDAATLTALAGALDRHFSIAPDARRSVELDPRATAPDQIAALAAAGWNTVSIGVQDFDQQVQEAIGRHQSPAETRELVTAVRAAGVDDLNIDLIYGLPRQTEESITTTVDQVVELGADRVALFGYAHVPELRPHQRILERKGRLPDRYERAALLLAASARLRDAGYVALGLDHFARPTSRLAQAAAAGRMTRNFQGYAERLADAVIGIGASAISSTPRAHWQNHAEVAPWAAAIARGELPVHRGLALTHDDRIRGDAITTLMCSGELDLDALGRRWAMDAAVYFADTLTALAAEDDLVTVAERRVVATPLGRVLIRNVCAHFDRYHEPGGRRGSSTV